MNGLWSLRWAVRPKLVASLLTAVGFSLAAIAACYRLTAARAEDRPAIATDGSECVASKSSLRVTYKDWSECITYYIIGKLGHARTAIFFVEGDVEFDEHPEVSNIFKSFPAYIGSSVNASYALKVSSEEQTPVVILGRPGLFGSTGDHRNRHRVGEYGLVGTAISQLVSKLGLTRVALVGHSGGASVIMGALSLGIREGNCIVAGSGVYAIADVTARRYANKGLLVEKKIKDDWDKLFFSHHKFLTGISKDPRRIFLVGDSVDVFSPFAQQARYAESLERAGHKVWLIEARSPRGDGHTFVQESLRVAARCLKGDDDERLLRIFGGRIHMR